MKISAKAEYAIKAMYEIALCSQNNMTTTVKDIAAQQKIPKAYLEQLIGDLKKAGLVRSRRGAKGGYSLARDSEAITAGEIIEAIEGPVKGAVCNCYIGCDCVETDSCVAHDVVSQLTSKMDEVLSGITLKSLIDKHYIEEEEQ